MMDRDPTTLPHSRLFDPARHEPLGAEPWDAGRARGWIEAIAADAVERFSAQSLWPVHPLDNDGGGASEPSTGLYFGAAGVIWALDALARQGYAVPGRDWLSVLPALATRNASELERFGSGVESMLVGYCGIAWLAYRLAPSGHAAHDIAASIERNATHTSNELMWGVPGTTHVALAIHEATGERRWADLYVDGIRSMRDSFAFDEDAGCRLWLQHLYGRREKLLGAAHGFAGNARTVLRGLDLLDEASRSVWIDDIVQTVELTAMRAGELANWPPMFTAQRPIDKMLVHWCHGAPGMIACIASLPDARVDEVLDAAGELVWRAGPLAKGPSLCHGTAGNGFAFLKLHERSGERKWLARARAFAMHAIAQSDAHAKRYAMRRYSLWTGDPGVALFVAACIDGHDRMPMFDADPDRKR